MTQGYRQAGGLTFLHDGVLESVLRLVRSGQDVALVGDVGAGRTTVLDTLAERLRTGGTAVVVLAGAGAARELPLGALLTHPALRPRGSARWGLPEATEALSTAVGTGASAIMLDDPHLLDDASVAVVAAVTRQRAGRVRLVLGAPLGVDLSSSVPDLARAVAVARVEPLGVSAMSTLLGDRLGGPIEANLVSALAGRSGGNPRVALALATAARDAGVISRSHGRWAQTGTIDVVRVDAVVHALLADVPEDLRRGLDVLAWLGLAELESAQRLVGVETLSALDTAGRVAVHESGHEHVVAVSPPALGQALRLRMTSSARAALRARAEEVLGSGRDVPAVPVLPESDEPSDSPYRGAHQQVAILSESVRTQASQRYRMWDEHRDVGSALPLLRLRLLDDLDQLDADEIFDGTVATAADDPTELASFVLLRAQWAACSGRSVREAFSRDPGPSGGLVLSGVGERFLAVLERACSDQGVAGAGLDDLEDERDVPGELRDFVLILRGQAALEAGHPDQVLDLLDGRTGSPGQRAFTHQLDALRSDALVLAGQVDDAAAWARDRLSAAYDDLSLFGVRLAARALATALFVAGDHKDALRALSVVLRTGRCGPVQSPYDERIFGLAAVLHARAGERELAAAMLDELRRTPRPYPPPLDFVGPWAAAEVEYFGTGGEGTPDGEAMWRAGAEHRDRGRLVSALLCWAYSPLELSDDRLEQIEELVAEVSVPLVQPILALRRALPSGTSRQILRAVAVLGHPGPLAQVALDVAARRAVEEGRGELTPDDVADVAGPALAAAVRRTGPRRAPLTAREIEIVALARSGLPNRQIASRLYLSVRTVESHLYRAMQKLGVSDRSQLASVSEEQIAVR